jgi:hypothetical protein
MIRVALEPSKKTEGQDQQAAQVSCTGKNPASRE